MEDDDGQAEAIQYFKYLLVLLVGMILGAIAVANAMGA